MGRSLADAALRIASVLKAGGCILVAGNGGSAAEAQHLASEMVGRFRDDRPAMRAVALTTDTSALTAIGNDYGFMKVFSRQVEALGDDGDLLVLLSTSGRSDNLLEAARVARSKGMEVVGLCGHDGGPMADLCDVMVLSDGGTTARIQEDHLAIVHMICEVLEFELLGIPMAPLVPTGPVDSDEARAICANWVTEGRVVAWTNGCFDLLHGGHLAVLSATAAAGSRVVVGLNSDASVRRLKGDGRPVVPFGERAGLLAAMAAVDLVVELDDDDPSAVIGALRPDVCVKGADYAMGGKSMPESAVVEGYGGRIVFCDLVDGLSTTARVAAIADLP